MASQHVPVRGGCACGAVRYKAADAPTQGFYCHCTICRKSYGGLYQATLKFDGRTFQLTKGELKHHRSSDFARRGFCAECGSPIVFLYEGNPNVWVLVGSLDHPEDWPLTKDAAWGPSGHRYVETRVPWHEIIDGLPQHGEAPGAIAAQLHVAS